MWQLIGQKKALELLQHGLMTSFMAHAFLFVGPEHIGKMTLAKDLAKALNCADPARPCHICPSCKKIEAETHTDVQFIRLTQGDEEDAEAMKISIEQIKDIQHSVSLPPFEGKHRVYIIEGAEMLSTEAANRLLKTLEEPPDNVTFILITINDKLLLPTVISRCQRIEFQPVPLEEEAMALTKKLDIPPEKAKFLAALSRGCPGWALTATNDDSTMERRNENLDHIVSIIDGNAEERFSYVSKMADGFTKNRKAVYDILEMWQDYWRDIMLAKLDCLQLITNIDKKDEIIKTAGRFSLLQIKNAIMSMGAAKAQLKQNINPRLALEVLMLDLPQVRYNNQETITKK